LKFLILFLFCLKIFALSIIDKPIVFDEKRIELSKTYIQKHYDLKVDNIKIQPRMIVIHWTAINDFTISYNRFYASTLPLDRGDISKASTLNVSTHFMIDRDGQIYRLMDETKMARHVIGLNYYALGIENVGGEGSVDNLTPKQLQANIALIKYLRDKYSKLEYMIGHHEYTQCENTPLWLETDKSYKTIKYDPGEHFMQRLRFHFPKLKSCSEVKH